MGLFSWIASRPKAVADYGKKVVGTEEIKKNADFIVDMATSVSKKTKRFETFESAYSRLGLTEDQLMQTYNYYSLRFNIFVFFSGIALVALGYAVYEFSWGFFAILGFLSICLAQLFSASFRMYQIRRRELVPAIEWLREPKEWWIKPFKPMKTGKVIKTSSSHTTDSPVSRKKPK